MKLALTKTPSQTFFQTLRDAAGDWVDLCTAKKIGGPGFTVEVDETIMSKRKNHQGRVLPEIWVVGGICRETNECFATVVADRTSKTLENILKENIKKSTTIHTDLWKGYINIEALGFIHKTVNHSKNFVDPIDGTHTQKIERFWRGIKDIRKKYQGIPDTEIESHINEYLWRRTRNVTFENCFEEALSMLTEVQFR